jgi:hypothetical protein
VRMDKALMLVVGGLLTAFALIPDEQGQKLSTETESAPPSATAPAIAESPQAQVPMLAEPVSSVVPHAAPLPATNKPAAHGDYRARREAQRARINAEEIAHQTPIY